MVNRLYPISYLVTAESLKANSQYANSPVKGTIRQIIISWPDGCNFFVEALFRRGKTQFYPSPSLGPDIPQGVALNNYTLTTAMNYPIEERDNIELIVNNHDGAQSHTISAIILVEEAEEKEYKEQEI